MVKKYKKYSKQFKQEAVAMTEQEGVTVVEVAHQLGIKPKNLYAWRKPGAELHSGKSAMEGVWRELKEQVQ